MSYSTYLTIYGMKRGNNISNRLSKVCRIFDANCDIIPDAGYWQKTNDDYITFSEYVKKNIIRSISDKHNISVFVFCNHDGETDDEVYQSFIEFAKVLSFEWRNILIEICSDVDTENVHIISHWHGHLKLSKEECNHNSHTLKEQISTWMHKQASDYHNSELKKLSVDRDTQEE